MTKKWYICPEFGYRMVMCPVCDGPHMRCQTEFGLVFRYVTSVYWAYTTMTTVGEGGAGAAAELAAAAAAGVVVAGRRGGEGRGRCSSEGRVSPQQSPLQQQCSASGVARRQG